MTTAPEKILTTSFYAREIARLAPDYDPAQIEAWMRLEHGTLDALSPDAFAREVVMSCLCIDADPHQSAALAKSYGL